MSQSSRYQISSIQQARICLHDIAESLPSPELTCRCIALRQALITLERDIRNVYNESLPFESNV